MTLNPCAQWAVYLFLFDISIKPLLLLLRRFWYSQFFFSLLADYGEFKNKNISIGAGVYIWHIRNSFLLKDSNLQHTPRYGVALPTELRRHKVAQIIPLRYAVHYAVATDLRLLGIVTGLRSVLSISYVMSRKTLSIFQRLEMVAETGLEPVRYCYQRILSPLCLPFHHSAMVWYRW